MEIKEVLDSLQKNIEALNRTSPHIFDKEAIERLDKITYDLIFYTDAVKAVQMDYDYDMDVDDYENYN